MQEHVILVAVQVKARDREQALHLVEQDIPDVHGDNNIESWWIAEDDRQDGSDCDSAVFVSPGNQAHASALLFAAGWTPSNNVTPTEQSKNGPFEPTNNIYWS